MTFRQDEIGLLTPEQMRALWSFYEQAVRIGLLDKFASGNLLPPVLEYPEFHNDSGSTIPAYACIQITGTTEVGGRNFLEADQPADADGSSGWYLFNGHYEVADDEYGTAQLGPVFRAYKNTGTITAGENWAPTASQWYLTQDDDGIFCATGEDDISSDVFKVIQVAGSGSSYPLYHGVTDASIAARSGTTMGSGTVSLYNSSGATLSDSTDNVTAYNMSETAVASGAHVVLALNQDNKYVVIVESCS